ncbi:hypothetical protein CHGG_00188 [Chaetomium globosum CBS 148.51]|uniref:Heterokaryon incompatibility domain-containing protein n=1 Tax=Chaetomium globosum (strain ATCC 6205 / CBS 148.51 / DSM 1962 / NBRC 6347 / NRRL 1970) TaxID=306901 RepID=Q2HHW6_CHAGB|nr:uncharacterized protein CHGG_00188 [Chaetomium globosum CBS 148.51]EAQ91953.1 hypothetical protein CHGG_00188 [Chaetomium globosum CBS 148.51]
MPYGTTCEARRRPGSGTTANGVTPNEEDAARYPVSKYRLENDRQLPLLPGLLELTISFNEAGLKSGGGCPRAMPSAVFGIDQTAPDSIARNRQAMLRRDTDGRDRSNTGSQHPICDFEPLLGPVPRLEAPPQSQNEAFYTASRSQTWTGTFRDAIHIARSLGPQRQGPTPTPGCYPLEGQPAVEPCVVELEKPGFPNGRYLLYDHRYRDVAFQDMPLLRRGWVVQELLLASRVLHFCPTEMFWECFELTASETYPSGLPPRMRDPWVPRGLIWKAFRSLPDHADGGAATADGNGAVALHDMMWYAWPQIVQYYSICGLTYASDKLVAISGCAKLIQQAFKVDYRAGLWDHDLEDQLLWAGNTSEPRYPPCAYRAPTWSWASMDGGIAWSWHGREGSRWKRVASTRDCHIETRTEDATVGIVSGFLRLSGWLITLQLSRIDRQGRHWNVFANGAWQDTAVFINLDSDLPAAVTDRVHALPIVGDTLEDQPASICCLLLHATGHKRGWFYRIGVMVGCLGLGVPNKDYSALAKVRNESWLEYEACDDAGLFSVVVV